MIAAASTGEMDRDHVDTNGGVEVALEDVIIMSGSPRTIEGESCQEEETVAAAPASTGDVVSCKESLCTRVVAVRTQLQNLPLDWMCLSVVLLIVWGLLILPIIYFHTDIVSFFCIANN